MIFKHLRIIFKNGTKRSWSNVKVEVQEKQLRIIEPNKAYYIVKYDVLHGFELYLN